MLRAILGYTVTNAEVAELADAPALGAGGRKAVGVRVPSSALPIPINPTRSAFSFVYKVFLISFAKHDRCKPRKIEEGTRHSVPVYCYAIYEAGGSCPLKCSTNLFMRSEYAEFLIVRAYRA
jgi:hypothetical protein